MNTLWLVLAPNGRVAYAGFDRDEVEKYRPQEGDMSGYLLVEVPYVIPGWDNG